MRAKPCIETAPEPTDADWERLLASGIKLDLGCGDWCRPGFIGIDRKFGCEVFPVRWDNGTLLPDECATEIVASHILEHFSHKDTQAVLNEWVRVLRPGGVIRIAVPDFNFILNELLNENPRELPVVSYLFGGQRDEDDYHHNLFTEARLERYMAGAGLTDIKRWESDQGDCSHLEVSLNLQGTK